MNIQINKNPVELGRAAASSAAQCIREAIAARDTANIILATGTSQFETINHLVKEKYIDWAKVTMFHLDEYIGLPMTSPASFRKYLLERFLSKLPAIKQSFLIDGEKEPETECERLGKLIVRYPIDVALVGIGENGHLAFNDPPADFETEQPFIIVQLDEACRQQQWKEGWFQSVEEIPRQAISMSIKQILKSKYIICSVPDARKAVAVKDAVEMPPGNYHPASILQLHENCTCFLDPFSSSLISADYLSVKEKN